MIAGMFAVWFLVAAALFYLDLVVVAALVVANTLGLLVLVLLARG